MAEVGLWGWFGGCGAGLGALGYPWGWWGWEALG